LARAPRSDSVALFKKGPTRHDRHLWLGNDNVEFTANFLHLQVFGKQVFSGR
jgi:hypothetical protein